MIERPEDLSAFLDGELTDSESILIESHLSGCSDCRAELEGLRAARSAVRGLALLTPPSDVFELVPPVVTPAVTTPGVATSDPEDRDRVGRSWRWMPVAASVAAIAIWAGVVLEPPSDNVQLATVVGQHATSSAGQPGSLLVAIPLEGISP